MKYWALEVLKEMVELRAIRVAWRALVTDKVVRARTVYNQIKPENLAPEKLEDPDVRQQIEEKGFYEVTHERQADFIEGLEFLVERGYVEKRDDRIYDVGWYYIAHPYIPARARVCECRLRFGDSPITMIDITIFHEKILVIKENEGRGVDTIFHYWFVTNAETFEEGVKDYADNVGIDIMKAELSTNWVKRAHWKVNNLIKDE